jgi:hypothetical protein
MFWVSLLAIFSDFTCFLLCCTILILSCMQEHFCLAEGISLNAANIVLNKVARKVTKDSCQTCPPCLYCPILHWGIVPFVVIFIVFNEFFYVLTTIVVLLVGDEAADKATLDVGHLPQGAVPSREGCLAGQSSRGLGRDVRVVVIPRV